MQSTGLAQLTQAVDGQTGSGWQSTEYGSLSSYPDGQTQAPFCSTRVRAAFAVPAQAVHVRSALHELHWLGHSVSYKSVCE